MKLAEFGELLEGELGVFHDEVHVHFVTEHFQCSRFGCFRAAFFDAFFDASAFDAFAEITHVIDLLFKCRSHGDLKVILQDLFFFWRRCLSAGAGHGEGGKIIPAGASR